MRKSKKTRKKARTKREAVGWPHINEILPEYDFSQAARNRYASRFPKGGTVGVLAPDVAAAFPSSTEANEALRKPGGGRSETPVVRQPGRQRRIR